MSAQAELDFTANALGPWREGQPETARQAALDNYPRSGTQRARVLIALFNAGGRGATDYELALAAGICRPHIAGTRRAELQRAGFCEITAYERPTDTGNMATVWQITPKGVGACRALREAE